MLVGVRWKLEAKRRARKEEEAIFGLDKSLIKEKSTHVVLFLFFHDHLGSTICLEVEIVVFMFPAPTPSRNRTPASVSPSE